MRHFGSGLFVGLVFTLLAGCSAANGNGAPGAPPQALRHGGGIIPAVHAIRGAQRDAPSGLTPADLQSAYALPSAKNGTGQIVAILDAYDNPNVAFDLAQYRSTFGLPAANFTKYNQQGETGNYPQGDAAWGIEIDLDVEMLSASCPNCTIYLLEANSNAAKDLNAAAAEAVKLGAHVVNSSFGCSTNKCLDQSDFDKEGVIYLGANGDSGFSSPTYPADFASVVAVGGTVLAKGGGKRGWTESVWSAASGGCISGVKKPSWQHDTGCNYRLANDVSAAAQNLAEFDTYSQSGWFEVDGTAAASPFLAGVFGLAGNATKQDGGRTFWEKAHQKHLYGVTQGASQCAYGQGQYNACTGWGTPHGIGAF